MQGRKLLLVHESRVTQNLLSRVIKSEFNDMDITPALSAEEAKAHLSASKFDLVMSAENLRNQSESSVLAAAKSRAVPMVIMTPTDTPQNRVQLNQKGFEHVLGMPFTPDHLRQAIFDICDPSAYRKDVRLNMPGLRVFLNWGKLESEVEVINISRTAVFGSLEFRLNNLDLLKQVFLKVRFPRQISEVTFQNIHCKLVRLEIKSWNENGEPALVSAVWRLDSVPAQDQALFNHCFDQAESFQAKALQMINA